tara:strand:- start:88 stop:729 length:642 start_codon:yes stop_codon:yes gene_type:complete
MPEQNFDPTHRWFDLCYRNHIQINEAVSMCNELIDAYNEPHRYYHTMNHVYSCLNLLDGLPVTGEIKDMLEFATWFHDLIYNAASETNEQESATLAYDWLENRNVSYAQEVKRMIELSADYISVQSVNETEKIFQDLDLAILGSSKVTYQEYATNIRKEYKHMSDEEFNAGRASFIAKIIEKKTIFQTEAFHDLFEETARENMRNELEQLTQK